MTLLMASCLGGVLDQLTEIIIEVLVCCVYGVCEFILYWLFTYLKHSALCKQSTHLTLHNQGPSLGCEYHLPNFLTEFYECVIYC